MSDIVLPVPDSWDDTQAQHLDQQFRRFQDTIAQLESQVAYLLDISGVKSYGAIIADDAGNGTVEGDCAATNFSASTPGLSPEYLSGQALLIVVNSRVSFGHKSNTYQWIGPTNVTVGSGGSYTPGANDFAQLGTGDHSALINRGVLGSHPQSAITDLVGDQNVQDGGISTNAAAIAASESWQADHINPNVVPDPHTQLMLEADALFLFSFAAYAEAVTPENTAYPDLGVSWEPLDTFSETGVSPRGITINTLNGQFGFAYAGVYNLSLSGSMEHDNSNSGRITYVRIYNYTTSSVVGSMALGSGRNVEDTTINASLLAEITVDHVGDQFGFEIGGGDAYSAVNFQTLRYSISAISEWRDALP